MDSERAKIFLTVANLGSLSAAADRLGYTTSGISRSIAALEEETGFSLFTRSKKGMKLTKDAELLLPVMRELVHQDNLFKETVDRVKGLESGTVTIGVSYAGYFKLIADVLKDFTDRYPGIKIKTMQATSTELLRALEEHEADLAVMTYRESSLRFCELRNDPMVACVPTDHPLAGQKVFPLKRFGEDNYIAPYPNKDTDYGRALESAGIRPNIQYTTTDIYAAYCMVEAGLGVSLLNRLEIESWKGKVKILKTDPEVYFRIGVMYPEADSMTTAAQRFVAELIAAIH